MIDSIDSFFTDSESDASDSESPTSSPPKTGIYEISEEQEEEETEERIMKEVEKIKALLQKGMENFDGLYMTKLC